ncbi:CvpA family protein [Acidicapsa ligni]|uniref:CvpA family protein n=1 Tax=Acidicapsa ligni TaxID=542300 RepID=UPI0021E0C27D|nr:CvpA family protein [Acidicapsa ligni]
MNVVDIAIVVVLLLSAIVGYRTGLIQSIFSLVGLILGIAVASWNYRHFADDLWPLLHNKSLSEAIWFCLLALAVMIVAGLLGMLIKNVIHGVGLAWLDRLAGFVFGFLRGALLVTLCIVTMAAFYPRTQWLGKSQLTKYFLGTAHLTTQMTPDELKHRILDGLRVLEKDTPEWMHPEKA